MGHLVFEVLLLGAAETGNDKGNRGTVNVSDQVRVDEAIGGGLADLLANRLSVVDSEGTHYDWTVAVAIARRAFARAPQRVISYVEKEEAKPLRGPLDLEVVRPSLDLLREWGKKELFDNQNQLTAARSLPADEQVTIADYLAEMRSVIDGLDPIAMPGLLVSTIPEPSPERRKPFLKGWNPYCPQH